MQQLHRHDHSVSVHGRQDPTKTTLIRARYERDMVRRFRALIKAIREKLAKDDFGFNRPVTNAPFNFPRSQQKVAAFMKWLKEMERKGILEITHGMSLENAAERAWQNIYLRSAYQRGLAMAAQNLRSAGATVTDRWIDAGFYRPIHADRIGLIYQRTYSDLNGITDAMDRKISRELAQGLLEGRSALEIADNIVEAVEKIGILRGRTIARTETIRAHADATLATYREAGADGVNLQSEFTTSQDEAVCPDCEELEGQVYTIDEAEGIIPVHPNCRCAWIPVLEDATQAVLQ